MCLHTKLRSRQKAFEDNGFQGNSTNTKVSAKTPEIKEEQEVMKIAGIHERRNEKVKDSTENSSIGNKGIIYTEFIFLLTGDLNFLNSSDLTPNPKGNELKNMLCDYRIKNLNEQSF